MTVGIGDGIGVAVKLAPVELTPKTVTGKPRLEVRDEAKVTLDSLALMLKAKAAASTAPPDPLLATTSKEMASDVPEVRRRRDERIFFVLRRVTVTAKFRMLAAETSNTVRVDSCSVVVWSLLRVLLSTLVVTILKAVEAVTLCSAVGPVVGC